MTDPKLLTEEELGGIRRDSEYSWAEQALLSHIDALTQELEELEDDTVLLRIIEQSKKNTDILFKDLQQATELLRGMEWDRDNWCPSCTAHHTGGHYEKCDLAAFLPEQDEKL